MRLTLPEIRELESSLFNADIVNLRPDFRRRWGWCALHSWGYALIEIELRGGRPFSSSILYADLTHRAAQACSRHPPLPWKVARRALQPDERCFTCEYVKRVSEADVSDPARLERMRERIERLEQTASWFDHARPYWEAMACPQCLGGKGVLCRPHLLEGSDPPESLAAELEQLADRLDALVESMTWGGRPVTGRAEAAWIEALSWFGGWELASELKDETGAD